MASGGNSYKEINTIQPTSQQWKLGQGDIKCQSVEDRLSYTLTSKSFILGYILRTPLLQCIQSKQTTRKSNTK